MLKLDHNIILYKGQPVGRLVYDKDTGRTRVEVSLAYETDDCNWVLPLSLFAQGLSAIEPPPPPSVLDISYETDAVELDESAFRLLLEKKLKVGGCVWKFHKDDADDWPSELHGHDYDQNTVINAATGDIFDKTTRDHVGTMKKKDLAALHVALRTCKDTQDLANRLLPPADRTEGE